MSLSHLTDLPEIPENLRLHCRIGSGAAGHCFLVTDITDKALALKVVSADWTARESESLRAFRKIPAHHALAQIYGAGRLPDGRLYYTMELADNAGSDELYQADTLAYRLKNRSVPLQELLRIISVAASGAEFLHRHDLFHGDIKPENIIFVNGEPKLADFGTLSAERSGTAGFVPENPASGVDRDCYALGMTLYCAWSGLDAASFPVLPATFDRNERMAVRKIYLRACHSAAPRRFATAADLINALEKARTSRRITFPWKHLKIGALFLVLLLVAKFAMLFVPVAKALPVPDEATFAERERRYGARQRRRQAEDWMRKHPQEIQKGKECGLVFAFDPESGKLEIRDSEFGIRCGDDSWLTRRYERYVEIKHWMREHPDEVKKIRACGISFAPDPEFGMQLRDSRNGYQAVGDLKSLLDYWKNGLPAIRPRTD